MAGAVVGYSSRESNGIIELFSYDETGELRAIPFQQAIYDQILEDTTEPPPEIPEEE